MIILTGASGGIGNFLMQRYVAEGVEVLGLYNTTEPTENIDLMYQVDVSDYKSVSKFVNEVRGKLTNITLINSASVNYNCMAHLADPVRWANLVKINLIGTFNMVNALLPFMREQQYGRIINFSSVLAQKGVPGTSAYAASKSGLWGLTKTIAIENATKGITINNLNLGYFNIGMTNTITAELQKEILKSIPVKRYGDPIAIYNAINYLIDSDYITGTNIDINGGLF